MYLEDILVLSRQKEHVRSIDIVNMTGYSKPSVSRAVNLLKKSGYLFIDSDGYLTLSDSGREIAEMIYERHTILAEVLENIGVPHELAVADACKIEHDISPETFDAIKNHIKEHS